MVLQLAALQIHSVMTLNMWLIPFKKLQWDAVAVMVELAHLHIVRKEHFQRPNRGVLPNLTGTTSLGYFCSKLIWRKKQFEWVALPSKSSLETIFQVLKKFWKNVAIDRKFSWFYLLKVTFSGHFLPSTNLAPSCTWKFGMSTWSRTNLIIENWFWIQRYPQSKV